MRRVAAVDVMMPACQTSIDLAPTVARKQRGQSWACRTACAGISSRGEELRAEMHMLQLRRPQTYRERAFKCCRSPLRRGCRSVVRFLPQPVPLRAFEPCQVLLIKRISIRRDPRQQLGKRDSNRECPARGH